MRSPYFKYYLLRILNLTICLLSILRNSNAFNPLIQLPIKAYRISKTVVLNIDDFGARGDGITDDSKTLQSAWEVACSLESPVKIVIPAGKFYLFKPSSFGGPCQSKVTFKISGIVVAPQDPEIWLGFDVHKWLYFHNVDNLTVEGDGIIDGMGHQWWAQSCKTNESNPCTHAPTAVTFHRCNNLKVRDVTLVNSQQMHMAFTNCMHVTASGLKIIAPANSPNTDGIHISASTHVQLKNAIISTGNRLINKLMLGDDCISIVSNSSQIRINNIVCGPGHGISIGSLGKNNSFVEVHDVIVDGAYLFDTENGVRIKTWQGGSGFARKIIFQNIRVNNVSNPIIIDQYYCDSPEPCLNQTSAVRINNISFRNIKGTLATEDAIILSCSESHPCKRLYLENIQLISSSGVTKSFCWEAYGASSGLIYPPSCISSLGTIIQHDLANSTSLQSNEHAFI